MFENQGTNPAAVAQEYKSTSNLTALKETLLELDFQDPRRGVFPPKPFLIPIRGSGREDVGIRDEQPQASLTRMGLY